MRRCGLVVLIFVVVCFEETSSVCMSSHSRCMNCRVLLIGCDLGLIMFGQATCACVFLSIVGLLLVSVLVSALVLVWPVFSLLFRRPAPMPSCGRRRRGLIGL